MPFKSKKKPVYDDGMEEKREREEKYRRRKAKKAPRKTKKGKC